MFMLPEPPPLDYSLKDISPLFISDGIFHHEKPTATHKYVAKQLVPIKRKITDPLAPVQELDSRTLNRDLERVKEFYVADPGNDHGVIFQTLSIMPKWKREHQGAQNSLYSIFPRSPQFEFWHIRDRRSKDFAKRRITIVECTKKEETLETDDEPCAHLKPPFWWKDKPGKARKLPLGDMKDYAYQKLKDSGSEMKISEIFGMDHPRKYIPGAIHRLTNPEDTSMQDALARADTFKVVLKMEEPSLNTPPVDECVRSTEKHPPSFACCNLKATDKEVKVPDSVIYANDRRWWSPEERMEFPKNDLQREEELRKLTRPFSHDLHTWYSTNKPSKLLIPVRQVGKKVILERRFSHL